MFNRIKEKTLRLRAILLIAVVLVISIQSVACSTADLRTGSTTGTVTDSTSSTQASQAGLATDSAVQNTGTTESQGVNSTDYKDFIAAYDNLPEYTGSPYIIVNDNVPFFTEADMTTSSFEEYGELDSLGRCSTAYANVGKDLMPTQKRGSIGSVKPTGWQTVKYDSVDGKYLYNRCHLIGYQLTAENANKQNLITGTRYLNVDGMLPFENMVADYIKETNNHVLYRVTPIFTGDELVARGVLMEAESVEDKGEGILFNVYCYNVQPGIVIDYATGESHIQDK